jgi:hypothetical protein
MGPHGRDSPILYFLPQKSFTASHSHNPRRGYGRAAGSRWSTKVREEFITTLIQIAGTSRSVNLLLFVILLQNISPLTVLGWINLMAPPLGIPVLESQEFGVRGTQLPG